MTPRALLVLGALLLALALALVVGGTVVKGPKNPECEGRPWTAECLTAARFLGTALQALALPALVAGGVVLGLAVTRLSPDPREAAPPEPENAFSGPPPSDADDGAP